MVDHTLDMILVIAVLSFWILFPIGMFWSVAHVDKNTDQIIRLDKLRHESMEPATVESDRKVAATSQRRPQDKRKPRDLGRPRLAH